MAFKNRMQALLGAEALDFFAAMNEPAQRAFHINGARISEAAILPWLLAEDLSHEAFIPGIARRYCFEKKSGGIGSLPAHHAGMLYSQDPSALLPLAGYPINDNMRILDLCAAPGGKSSQLAQAVDGGSGFLIANEPVPSRARILVQNMERMGYRNVIVSCLDPSDIAAIYPEYFDLVLVDAPCSGEGMFRKYPESVEQWSEENISRCAGRGREILTAAVSCLKPGGRLVYCTCTYAPEENEEQLAYLKAAYGLSSDESPQWIAKYAINTAEGGFRLYPHRFAGEGQFAAYFVKPGKCSENNSGGVSPLLKAAGAAELKALRGFYGETADKLRFYTFKDRIITISSCPRRLPEHGIMLPGVTAAEYDKNKKRYIPHHQFFSAYGNELKHSINLCAGDERIARYLNGQELSGDGNDSAGACGSILLSGVPLGGFRSSGSRLKNLYPKGLRTHL